MKGNMKNNHRVIFVNISYNSFTRYSELVIKKLLVFFEMMKTETDYLVWWRPHPELEEKLERYDINLYENYLNLKRQFLEKQYGWFDEASSIQEALEVSDIYYGDGGTVVHEFVKRGKKIILPNYTGDFFPIGICKYKDYIYGTDHDTSAIVRYSLLDNKWEYVTIIPQTYGMQKAFHKSVIIDDDRLMYIPYKASALIIYEPLTDVLHSVNLKLESLKLNNESTKFWGFYRFENKLYLLPAGYPFVMAVDLISNEVIKIFDLSDVTDESKIITWLSWEEIRPGVLALASMQKNQVLILDFNNLSRHVYDIGNDSYKFTEIRKNDSFLYLIVKNEPVIIKWDLKNDTTEEIKFDRETFGEYGPSIFDDYANCIYQDKMFCFPAKSKGAYKIDLNMDSIERLKEFDEFLVDDISISQFDTVVVDEDMVYIQSRKNKFLTYDLNQEHITAVGECILPINDITRMEIELIRTESEQ